MTSVTLNPGGGDDAAAINAALSDPDVTEVMLGAGTFIVQSPIFVPSGKSLTGAGRDLTTIRAEGDFDMTPTLNGVVCSEVNAVGVHLADFSVDANKLLPDSLRLNGVFMKQATDFSVERVDVYNATGYGFFAQGDANGFTAYASGTFTDCAGYNCQITFEQMTCDGVTLTNCFAGDGDGDLIGTYFHPLTDSKNITYINCVGYGFAYAGFDLLSNRGQLENIRIIDSEIELLGGGAAIVTSGVEPTIGLELSGSRFIAHQGLGALLVGTTGTAVDSLFQGLAVGIEVHESTLEVTDSVALGLRDPSGGGAAYGVVAYPGADVNWDGGTIEGRAAPGLMYPISGTVDVSAATELVAAGYDAVSGFVENGGSIRVAPAITLSLGELGGLAGGTFQVGFQANGTTTDRLAIVNQGNGTGQIGVSGDVVSYEGAAIGTFSGGLGGTDLVVALGAGATAAALQALARAIAYLNPSEDPSPIARVVEFVIRDGAGATADASAAILVTTSDDPAVARDDLATADENALVEGNVLLDNGFGIDGDVDDPLQVAAVNGSSAAVGTQILLASGARLTVSADGSYVYNPNGAFNYLVSPESATGAAISTATDSFTYSLADGATATVTITIDGLNSAGDQIWGDSGADFFTGTTALEYFVGGEGNDYYFVTPGDRIIELADEGFDTAYAQASYVLPADASVELLATADWRLTERLDLAGNELNNAVTGNEGVNVLRGGDGIDTLRGLGGNDLLDGGAGSDQLFGNAGDDSYFVTSGDRIFEIAGEGTDYVYAFESFALTAGAAVELLATADWRLTKRLDLVGNELNNAITGNEGVNILRGGDGDDTLRGLDGADTLDGGAGIDQLFGGTGNDNYYVTAGDRIHEAIDGGFDTAYSTESFVLSAGASVEALATADWRRTDRLDLTGNELNNAITGNEGVNVLRGGDGGDTLRGLGGDDLLDGGAGRDQLFGHAGGDRFSFASPADSAAAAPDRINDFEAGSDLIDLSAIDADVSTGESDAFTFVGTAAFSGVAGELRAFEQAAGFWIVEGDVDGDRAADLVIQVSHVGAPSLAGADFVL